MSNNRYYNPTYIERHPDWFWFTFIIQFIIRSCTPRSGTFDNITTYFAPEFAFFVGGHSVIFGRKRVTDRVVFRTMIGCTTWRKYSIKYRVNPGFINCPTSSCM